MTLLIGISGSLRRRCYNSALLIEAQKLMPPGAWMDILSIREVPLYNGDLERSDGIPAAVTRLKEAIAAADDLLVSSPEYNNSIPGVLKNAVDWMSRPSSDIRRVFGGKPVAMVGASPGGFGTILGQNAWLPVWRTLGVQLWTGGRLLVSRASDAFAEDGALKDDKVRDQLRSFMAGFVAFASRG